MGTVTVLHDDSVEPADDSSGVYWIDDLHQVPRGNADDGIAVTADPETPDRVIRELRLFRDALDRLTQLVDDGDVPDSLREDIKSMQASLVLASNSTRR